MGLLWDLIVGVSRTPQAWRRRCPACGARRDYPCVRWYDDGSKDTLRNVHAERLQDPDEDANRAAAHEWQARHDAERGPDPRPGN